MKLQDPLFHVLERPISGRDLILIGGGLFLLWKSVHEIHNSLEGDHGERQSGAPTTFGSVLAQIAVLDLVFSLDSVITAVGMAEHIEVMIAAVVIAVGVMMFAARPIGDFVDKHPTLKILALAFLILVGVSLVAEGLHFHIPKGYIYFSMAFAMGVELLNLRARAKAKAKASASQAPAEPVQLHKRLE
jgi:predicted tellurium resistance membrane protein TerC